MLLYSGVILLLTLCEVPGLPQRQRRLIPDSEPAVQLIEKQEKILPLIPINAIAASRKKKAPTLPISVSVPQIIVPNLHVIPLSNVRIHGVNQELPTIVSHTVSHGTTNVTHQLVPVLIPIHNLVPVHELTVIPLHSVVHKEPKISFKISDNVEESVNRYRNPIGGYGAGWYYGGHGAGHGFHYSYG